MDNEGTEPVQGDNIKLKRKRSPNFPCISLEAAIERGRKLYERAQTHPVPVGFVAGVWGYKEKSSSFITMIGALNAFGLIIAEGTGDKRKIAISRPCERIVRKAPDADRLVSEAALQPRLFREVWEKYGGKLPHDEVLKQHLLWNEEDTFNEKSIETFIANLRETITFAKLGESDIIPPEKEGDRLGDGKQGEHNGQEKPPGLLLKPPQLEGRMKNFTFPLIGGDVATLQVPHPMSDENFNALKAIIDAFKTSLTSGHVTDQGSEKGGQSQGI